MALFGLQSRERRKALSSFDLLLGSCSGRGKRRRFSMLNGTIRLFRPRVRGQEERFVTRNLPLFKRRTWAVGDLLPEL